MRVLIAHASEASRRKLAAAVSRIRSEPLDIVETGDGPGTLELLLQDRPPQVALVDWDLPDIDAPEMCRLVRDFHHGHDTWLIVLASAAHPDTSDVWRAGADDCISTPASPDALRERVWRGVREMTPAAGLAEAPRPTLDAICRCDDDGRDHEVTDCLKPDLRATVAADDPDDPAELAAGPAELTAQYIEVDDLDDAPRDHVTLDALLASI
jgi:two-component system chemotaxis response regulator CheY